MKTKIALEAINTAENYVNSLDGTFSWFHPALVNDYVILKGDLGLNWNGNGYKTILEVMMKKLPNPSEALPIDDKIHLNSKVDKITWTETGKVNVVTKGGGHHTADHVIFTPSLGVLKANHDDLFEPKLPQKKVESIEKLGIEAAMKILIEFPEKQWPNNFASTILIWSDEDRENSGKQFTDGPILDGKSWVTDIFFVHLAENNPRVMIMWLTGKFVPEVEKLDDTVIVKGASYVLDKFFGKKYNISKPIATIHSKWYANPNFRGTYSFETVEAHLSEFNCHEELGRPLTDSNGTPTVLFAGEATHPKYYSTVHGAIETGYREAERLLKYHNVA